MKALFFAAGTQTPASRFRVQQFFPSFEQRGIECTLATAYGDRYTTHAARPYAAAYKLASRLRRVAHLSRVGAYDFVFHQRSALNYTALPERIAASVNHRVVVDFDDAIYLDNDGRPNLLTQRAFTTLMRSAAHVIAGNSHLASMTGKPDSTSVIPTVIDTDLYTPAPRSAAQRDGLTIGWMGSASNLHELRHVAPALRTLLSQRRDLTFKIVSNGRSDLFKGLENVLQVQWTKAGELSALRSFDIGLMPLTDSAWTRGKCGFKLIQYMATGVPVVASAVGANVEIVGDTGVGALVENGGDWVSPIANLLDHQEIRTRSGDRARQRVVESYSVSSAIDRYISVFERVTD